MKIDLKKLRFLAECASPSYKVKIRSSQLLALIDRIEELEKELEKKQDVIDGYELGARGFP